MLASVAAAVPEDADTLVAALFDGEQPPAGAEALAPLLASGEAKAKPRALALARDGGRRVIGIGLGARDGLDAEAVRVAAAVAHGRCKEIGSAHVALLLPAEHATAAVEGILLAAYRYDAQRSKPGDRAKLQQISLVGADAGEVEQATTVADAVNAARDLQNAPSNVATPAFLTARAWALAFDTPAIQVEVLDRATIEQRGYGAFAAVASGSAEEPALIVLRYEPAGAAGPLLGFVGKAVTWDSGGYSLKPPASMPGMKFDMSGGAAVIEAIGAVAKLALPVRLVAVVGATDNMVDGAAFRPGDVVRAGDGTTIEITNTDAEGRLVLADCLLHARELGAELLVDIATLTGGVNTTFGGVYAALLGTDDAWVERVRAAGEASGDLLWRLPLHPAYEKPLESRVADVINANLDRRAQPITAAHFLARFAGELPYAHIDMAGCAADRGVPYANKGGSGFGVRLLVALARAAAAAPGE